MGQYSRSVTVLKQLWGKLSNISMSNEGHIYGTILSKWYVPYYTIIDCDMLDKLSHVLVSLFFIVISVE